MSKKILSIDDSKTVRLIIKRAFKDFEVIICEAGNGVEGLKVAESEMPDLIILDITMPVMDGVTMLGHLKQHPTLKDIPVIMLTAEHGQTNVATIVALGVRDYLVKPFKDEQLVEKAIAVVPLPSREIVHASELLRVTSRVIRALTTGRLRI